MRILQKTSRVVVQMFKLDNDVKVFTSGPVYQYMITNITCSHLSWFSPVDGGALFRDKETKSSAQGPASTSVDTDQTRGPLCCVAE